MLQAASIRLDIYYKRLASDWIYAANGWHDIEYVLQTVSVRLAFCYNLLASLWVCVLNS